MRLALRRLSLRRQNNLSERRFFEEERDRRRGGARAAGDTLDHQSAMTPSESIMSLGGIHAWASRGPYLPDKLQIVKPLEGEGERRAGVGWRRRDVERYQGAGAKKASKRGRGAERERGKSWGWARKTVERERGRRWARDPAGGQERREERRGRAERQTPVADALQLLLVSDAPSQVEHLHIPPQLWHRPTAQRVAVGPRRGSTPEVPPCSATVAGVLLLLSLLPGASHSTSPTRGCGEGVCPTHPPHFCSFLHRAC